jgi:excisionase family DNA binding protein
VLGFLCARVPSGKDWKGASMRARSKQQPSNVDHERLITDEVARMCRVKPQQVRRLVKLGRLKAAGKPGTRLLFNRSDVEAYLTSGAKPNTNAALQAKS